MKRKKNNEQIRKILTTHSQSSIYSKQYTFQKLKNTMPLSINHLCLTLLRKYNEPVENINCFLLAKYTLENQKQNSAKLGARDSNITNEFITTQR